MSVGFGSRMDIWLSKILSEKIIQSFLKNISQDVNPLQRKAIFHSGKYLLIVAGPGTGKTYTLTYRIARMSGQLSDGQKILAITFTNKAADQMAERLAFRFPFVVKKVTVGTFHGFCLRFLRKHSKASGLPRDFNVASSKEAEELMNQAISEPSCEPNFPKENETKESRASRKQRIGLLLKSKAMSFSREQKNIPREIIVYNRLLRQKGLLDFDDLLLETLSLFESNEEILFDARREYSLIFIDEYQDINFLQQKLIKMLVGEDGYLTAIGDPNQAIYSFRGSDVRFFECFKQDFPGATVLSLSDNYRSAFNLLQAATQIISKNKRFLVPELIAQIYSKGNLTIYNALTDKAEAEFIVHRIEKMAGGTSMFSHDSGRVESHSDGERSFGEIAVLYRLNSQKALLKEALERSGIPYQASGDKGLVELPPVFEMVTFLRLVSGRRVAKEAMGKVIQMMVQGIGRQTAESVENFWGRENVEIFNIEAIEKLISTEGFLPGNARQGIKQFMGDINKIKDLILQGRNVSLLVKALGELRIWQQVFSSNSSLMKNVQNFERFARRFDCSEDLFDFLSLQRPGDMLEEKAEKVSLLTLHSAKGLEFPVVFIAGCEQGFIPLQRQEMDINLDEERRLFYVGMTRAKEEIFLTRAGRRRIFGKTVNRQPSPYLGDIEEDLKKYEHESGRKRIKEKKPEGMQMELF